MRELPVNLLNIGTVGKMIQNDFHHLDSRAGKHRHVIGADSDVGVSDGGHGLFSSGIRF